MQNCVVKIQNKCLTVLGFNNTSNCFMYSRSQERQQELVKYCHYILFMNRGISQGQSMGWTEGALTK